MAPFDDADYRNELPCVWSQAGVLAYRPCDRDYDCEGCELFHALRGGPREAGGRESALAVGGRVGSVATGEEDPVSRYLARLGTGCKLHLDRPYSQSHFWLRKADGCKVTLGVDAYVLRLLFPLDDIVLPRVGVWIKRGEPCGWIVRGRMAIPLVAPISAEVLEINDAYIEAVRAGEAPGDGDDWLVRLAAHETLDSVPGLYRGEQALLWYLRKIQLVKRYLREAMAQGDASVVGTTLTDGGAPVVNLEEVLGGSGFEGLVEEMFRMQI